MNSTVVTIKTEVEENVDQADNLNAVTGEESSSELQCAQNSLARLQSYSPKSSKPQEKSERTEEHELYGYNKKKILKHLMTNGCSAWSCAEVMSKFRVDPGNALAYFNNQAQLAQTHVQEECASLSFENISDWLRLLQEINLHEACNFESALIIKAIADNENHPNVEELGGVDLKSIYKFLGNALLGLPQSELNNENAKFLADEFENLINDVNTDHADSETKSMKLDLEKSFVSNSHDLDTSTLSSRQSLDPLCLDAEITKYL